MSASEEWRSTVPVIPPLLRRPSFWAGVVIAAPIFFVVRGGLALAPGFAADTIALAAMPISVLCLPLVIAVRLVRLRRTRLALVPEDFLVLAYVGVMGVALGFGVAFSTGGLDPVSSVAKFGQTMFPLLGYLMARLVIATPDGPYEVGRVSKDISAFLLGIVIIIVAADVGYILQTVAGRSSSFRYSLMADHIGPFYNYKMKRFFPAYLSMAATVTMAMVFFSQFKTPTRVFAFLAASVCGLSLLLLWSRTALVVLAVGFATLVVFAIIAGGRRIATRVVIVSVVLSVTAPVGVVVLSKLGVQSLGRILTTIVSVTSTDADLGSGDEARFERMGQGVEYGLGSPLGDMYRVRDHNGKRDVLETENGYLDIAVRGGPLALMAMLVLSLHIALRTSLKATRVLKGAKPLRERWALVALAATMIANVFVGNFWLNLSTEPYFAPFFWFCMGAGVAAARAVSPNPPMSSPDRRRALEPVTS